MDVNPGAQEYRDAAKRLRNINVRFPNTPDLETEAQLFDDAATLHAALEVLQTAMSASEERAVQIQKWAQSISIAADGIACAENDARHDAGLPTVDKS